MVRLATGTGLLLLAAAAKVLGALVGFLFGQPAAAPVGFPAPLQLADVLGFGLGAGLLLLGGRHDRRALHLGGFFLLLATSFSNRFLIDLARAVGARASDWLLVLQGLQVDAYLPLLLWLFLLDFPVRATGRARRRLLWGVRLSAVLGSLLFIANLLATVQEVVGAASPLGLDRLTRSGEATIYYPVVLGLVLAALVALAWRTHHAPREARRRGRVFTTALLVGAGPLFASGVVITAVPPYARFMGAHPRVFAASNYLLQALFLTLPFTTAYAILVHRILDVRLLARRAVQYLLARATVIALTTAPLLALGLYLYSHRHEPAAELLAGYRPLLLLAGAGIGLAAYRYRSTVLEQVDRRFFRDRYDARQILTALTERIRDHREPREMARVLARGLEEALHPEAVTLLLLDPRIGRLIDPRELVRPLDASSPLVRLAAAQHQPLEVEVGDRGSSVGSLPTADRHWLVDGGFRLLVPLVAADGELLGLLALGEKRSALPYLREDLELLQAIATSATLAMELERERSRPPTAGHAPADAPTPLASGAEPARECPTCGRLFTADSGRCNRCGDPLQEAVVPYLLPGRFRFEKRVGVGGMGVVYRATDLALGRTVAVKTLRTVSPERALRLRREGQTAAAVFHPNLASIFGLETWSGTPLLVMEFLAGGTLAERIRRGPLEPVEAARLGVVMALALEALHEEEILHRDVKPSNIGYSREGTPKLMDFGIARLAFDLRQDREQVSGAGSGALTPTAIWHGTERTSSHQIVGTLAYIAPELLEGGAPAPADDLWSLGLVLYEGLTGSRLFAGGVADPDLMERIRTMPIPDVREARPDCPTPLARFLARALDRDRSARPASAEAFAHQLTEVLQEIGV